MKNFYLIIFIFISIVISGCRSEIGILQNRSYKTISPTAIDIMSVTLNPTKTHVSNDKIIKTPEFPNNLYKYPSDILTLNQIPVICNENYCVYDGHFILSRPISRFNNNLVDNSYRYGSTQNGAREDHHGVEFNNPSGTLVRASADGTVEYAGNDDILNFSEFNEFYGNLVIVKHDQLIEKHTIYTVYAHLSEILVKTGQKVKTGQLIGKVGATGSAIGSHLHFEVRLDSNTYDATQNPELWLDLNIIGSEEAKGALAISMNEEYALPNNEIIKIENIDEDINYYEEAYSKDTPNTILWNEIFTRSNLDPGDYRITLYNNGDFFEEYVKINSGCLTHLIIDLQ